MRDLREAKHRFLMMMEWIARAEAIARGRAEYGEGSSFEIIEARCWNDMLESDDEMLFAESRNHEIIKPETNYVSA